MNIGIYDSGLGGLSVMQAIRQLLPHHNLNYLADTAYCPYGPRATSEVQARALACAGWLMARGAGIVVVACNTASSAALESLRAALPIPIVGMEPGLKPAIAATRTQQIGVLATDGTLAGGRFASLVERFAAGVTIQTVPCPDLVQQVERGDLYGSATRTILTRYLAPLLASKVDTLVLGCTHFHFLAPVISQLAGPEVTLIETASPVARRVAQLVAATGLPSGAGQILFATTADPAQVSPALANILGKHLPLTHADC